MTTINHRSFLTRTLPILLFIFLFNSNSIAQHSKHQAGPMLGYVEQMEVGIWYQTNQSATVELKYNQMNADQKTTQSIQLKSIEENYFITKFIVSNLKFGTEYSYEIWIDGKKLNFDYPLTFKTQDLWQWRKDAPNFTVAVGSCLYINEPEVDRPGKPYGGDLFVLESIAEKNPDLMLWTGDNFYYREVDFYSNSRLEYRNRITRQVPEMQKLLATAANYAIWDDHDYGPNDSDRNYSKKTVTLDLFNAYWFNPSAGEEDNKGIYFRFLFNDIDFFMMDDRYHRAPDKLKDENKPYFGDKQLTWLKDALLNSYAPFKIIVNGNQSINMNNPYEGMQEYKKEQMELLNFIKEHKIEGVVFISGDRHHTELIKLEQDGMYPLYEFTNSPLGSNFNSNLRDEVNNPLRVEGTLVNTTRNFGMLHFSGARKDRSLKMETYDSKGKLLWDYTINENQLKFKK